jgi:hypothetical protein
MGGGQALARVVIVFSSTAADRSRPHDLLDLDH